MNNFDGLCRIIWRHSRSDNQIRCQYEFGHGGKHSWQKAEDSTRFIGGTFGREENFITKELDNKQENNMNIVQAFVLRSDDNWVVADSDLWELEPVEITGTEKVIGHRKIDGLIYKVIKTPDNK